MEEMNRRESVVEEEEGRNVDEYKRRLDGGTRFSRLAEKGIRKSQLMLSSDSLSLE